MNVNKGKSVSCYPDIDVALNQYVADEIACEISKDVEELIFFSSYTVNFDVFQSATAKLKKLVHQKQNYASSVWENDALKVIAKYNLERSMARDKFDYLIYCLLRAQIQINESVISHFKKLCQDAHSLDYLCQRAEAIYALLFDESSV